MRKIEVAAGRDFALRAVAGLNRNIADKDCIVLWDSLNAVSIGETLTRPVETAQSFEISSQ
ncbi:MAG: hypothetical protein ACF788_09555 [Novipirellula sp. JB048]